MKWRRLSLAHIPTLSMCLAVGHIQKCIENVSRSSSFSKFQRESCTLTKSGKDSGNIEGWIMLHAKCNDIFPHLLLLNTRIYYSMCNTYYSLHFFFFRFYFISMCTTPHRIRWIRLSFLYIFNVVAHTIYWKARRLFATT